MPKWAQTCEKSCARWNSNSQILCQVELELTTSNLCGRCSTGWATAANIHNVIGLRNVSYLRPCSLQPMETLHCRLSLQPQSSRLCPQTAQPYSSLVRPIPEYSSSVWDGSLIKTQHTKIEAIQKRAARTVSNIPRTDHTTSTTKLIEDLEWQTLTTRREQRRLGLVRAIYFGEVATDMSEFISFHPNTNSTRRHDKQYLIPHCNSNLHKKSYFCVYCQAVE